ncbi:mucin-3B-like [Rhinatrema bivittatum]|uniref:mucin-3B-like n=1 Tax=Rhinatrema bivittatum TaxID=194408 RepID=UPI00112CA2E5|nr:mucin-3B-like [Rhinatrema bivittatum]
MRHALWLVLALLATGLVLALLFVGTEKQEMTPEANLGAAAPRERRYSQESRGGDERSRCNSTCQKEGEIQDQTHNPSPGAKQSSEIGEREEKTQKHRRERELEDHINKETVDKHANNSSPSITSLTTQSNSHPFILISTHTTQGNNHISTPIFTHTTESNNHISTPIFTHTTQGNNHISTPIFTHTTESNNHISTPIFTHTTQGNNHIATHTTQSNNHISTPIFTHTSQGNNHISTPIFTHTTQSNDHISTPIFTHTTRSNDHISTPIFTHTTERSNHGLTSLVTRSNATKIHSSTVSITETSGTYSSSIAATTSQIPVTCQNGGMSSGNGCACPVNFYGPACQYLKDVIIVENIQVSIQVTVEVTNEYFTPSLNDPFSPAYKIFSIRFSEQMQLVYGSIAGYQGVEIISLSPGSIIVNHKVIIEMPLSKSGNSNDLNAVYAQLNQSIQQKNCTSISSDKLCFNQTATNVSHKAIPDLAGSCLTSNVPAAYRQYYFLMNVSSALICVSNCSYSNVNHYNCNQGRCLVTSQGPTCFCEFTDLYWYNGDRCQVVINKRGVYGGVAVGLAVLLIIIIVLAIFLFKDQSKIHTRMDDQQRLHV